MLQTSQFLPIMAIFGPILAFSIGLFALLTAKTAIKRTETLSSEGSGQAKTLSDLQAQIRHVDLEFIKKLLVRTTDNEQGMKRLENNIDLLDEKLKSFMNRYSARFPRPKKEEPEQLPANSVQTDIMQQLEQQGKAFPLNPPTHPEKTVKYVRASQARQA